jgi:hypothetical protein
LARWITLAGLFGAVALAVLIERLVSRRRTKLTTVARHAVEQPDASPGGDIERLRTILANAEECIAQRDALVRRQAATIEELRDTLAEVWRSPEATSADYDRFKRLRTLIVKELHPDNAPKDSADWAARTELFKIIWPKIEAISEHEHV